MKKLNSIELRKMYLEFFENKKHQIIASSSLLPENDPTVLYTTAGMHPLVPYLLGESHPSGTRLTNHQKCIRTNDIDEVGDASHLTFFEMLGNWSLGDYFKEDAIKWSYEFLTSEKYLNIPKDKLYFTCFEGDEATPKDEESYNIWLSLGVEKSHIFYLSKDDNFWILGSGIGPCGPCTEMFYDTGKDACSASCDPSCSCGKYLEIWNDVFMEYYSNEDTSLSKLEQKNVDTGMGLERVISVLGGHESVYDIEEFEVLKKEIAKHSNISYEESKKEYRIILDHIRTATFILGDDKKITPSNSGAGYVLRRLIRRAMRNMRLLNIEFDKINDFASVVIETYKDIYKELERNKEYIYEELTKETRKFNNTLKDGEKHFRKVLKHLDSETIPGAEVFKLFDTFGFPLEMTKELAAENNLNIDIDGFHVKFKEHQEKSKTLDAGSAKGGLADQSYESLKYHTLAHLLLAALQEMFGKNIIQKGANINPERLRFDFNFDRKLTDEEKVDLEKRVNEMINSNTDVVLEEKTYEEAINEGATGIFLDKYDTVVKVYAIGNYSKEICGGPHIKNTSELGTFKITKEESSSSGVRRIKAILQ